MAFVFEGFGKLRPIIEEKESAGFVANEAVAAKEVASEEMPDSLPTELEGLRGDFVDACSLGAARRPLALVDTGERALSASASSSDLCRVSKSWRT